jgi:hypothetical protein
MVQYKIVACSAANCDELNQAAKDGFYFCEWMPGDTHALVARDVDHDERRARHDTMLDQLFQMFEQFGREYIEQLKAGVPCPPPLDGASLEQFARDSPAFDDVQAPGAAPALDDVQAPGAAPAPDKPHKSSRRR